METGVFSLAPRRGLEPRTYWLQLISEFPQRLDYIIPVPNYSGYGTRRFPQHYAGVLPRGIVSAPSLKIHFRAWLRITL